MTINIAISPCPNDTYIFENIYNKNIRDENFDFNFQFLDIEELNNCAKNVTADVIKISYANYFQVQDNYTLLKSGGAMGFGVGPLLVKKANTNINLDNAKIAIPGIHTTANFLLSYLMPNAKNKQEIIFNAIEDAVLNNTVDAGLLIHEGRFTYEEKGLERIADMGELWQQQTGLPIPLGCIVIKKSLGVDVKNKIEKMIADSIPDFTKNIILTDFIKINAQEMDENVMKNHIQLYVNEFSKDVGDKGLEAINKMSKILNS